MVAAEAALCSANVACSATAFLAPIHVFLPKWHSRISQQIALLWFFYELAVCKDVNLPMEWALDQQTHGRGDLPHLIAGFTSFHSRRHAKENSRRIVGPGSALWPFGSRVEGEALQAFYNGGSPSHHRCQF